jgi:hypothetical protein
MAELQWVIEVRCVNTLLASFKVGERGQHFCVDIDNSFDPFEFAKLIEGVEVAKELAQQHREKTILQIDSDSDSDVPFTGRIIEDRELADIRLLNSGELATVKITALHQFFAPSEFDRFHQDLKKAQQKMTLLRVKND